MVVQNLDLGYLGFFLGSRVNELVVESLAAAGFERAKQSHGYVVQHLIEEDRTITELASRMEVTQQAVSKVIAEMVSLGIVDSVVGEDRRARRIRLSKRGWESVRLARRKRRQVEARLIRKLGKSYDRARGILITCLVELGAIGRIESRRIREPR